LALGPTLIAAVVSGTSDSGILDSANPIIVGLDLPATCQINALLMATWNVTDSHPGDTHVGLFRLSDNSEYKAWQVPNTHAPQVGWTQDELGSFQYAFIAYDAYGNYSGPAYGDYSLVATPPPCVEGVALSTYALDFGTVVHPAPVSQSFTLTNTSEGSCPGTVSGTISEACGAFSVSPASYNLAQGESVTVTVTFAGNHSGQSVCEVLTSHGSVVCSVNDVVDAADMAASFSLSAAHPNPFNPTTTLRYALPETGMASLKVYDLQGGLKVTLVNGLQSAGQHEVLVEGGLWSSGVYVAVLEAAGRQSAQKLILSK